LPVLAKWHRIHRTEVDEAAGGTLFLDGVDCLPLAAQAKLLRLLHENEFRPVGSNQLRHADIRFVAATNREHAKEVERGNFRRDLYYRLNVVSLKLPALPGRADDIEALAHHFVATYAVKFHKPATELARPALRKLLLHDWPGNVRELQHTIERAVILAPGPVLRAADIPLDGRECVDSPGTSFQEAKARVVEQFERGYIIEPLRRCNGNISQASRESGKHRSAFFELMRKLGIKDGGVARWRWRGLRAGMHALGSRFRPSGRPMKRQPDFSNSCVIFKSALCCQEVNSDEMETPDLDLRLVCLWVHVRSDTSRTAR
jgi:DNA-binding NtrC family response regulator